MTNLTIDLTGSFRNQGRLHGEALAPLIEEIMGEILTRDQWEPSKVGWILETLEDNLREHAPELLEEMVGIAEGSKLPLEDIFTYNAIADVWMVHRFCTATAWTDTPEGPIIGKTNDIGQHREKYHHPFRRKSGDGLAAIWATWPGTVWSNCFVNERGLAFGGASLSMEARNERGIPSNCMLRVLMDRCGSAEEVLRACGQVPVMHHPAHNVICEATGEAIVIELTPLGTYVCQGPREPYVHATNHFCSGPYEGKDTAEARHVENSKRRFANLARLAGELPHTVDGMKQLLRDHAESGQICQHGNEDMWSSAAYVAIPRERVLLIARGQPCETDFGELLL